MSQLRNSDNENDLLNQIFTNFQPEISVESPGRINLIGEHTDYNHGYVMPTAIDKKIFFDLQKNGTSSTCRIYSETFGKGFEFDLKSFKKSEDTWRNYILGVVSELLKKNLNLAGFDCKIKSELPIGAGISSSAALECGLAAGLNKLFQLDISEEEIVFLSQAAENNFVGSNCGIMDQYASVLSRRDHLILLDCLNLQAEYIPADFGSCKILLINTMVSHSIADGEYNTRHNECKTALEVLQQQFSSVQTFRDVDGEMVEMSKHHLNGKQKNRILYVLEENKRVLSASEFLKRGDIESFGKLMYQSHYGLRDLYEVSCKELDFLVQYSENKDFIYGSRMMGGGFGGCTINLIEAAHIEEFQAEVNIAYQKKFGIIPDFITVIPSQGTVVKTN